MLNVYDSLIGHEVSYKSVIDRVIEYIEDELRTKDSSKDMPLGIVDVLVNQVAVPRQLPGSQDCVALILYYGIKLLIVRFTCYLVCFFCFCFFNYFIFLASTAENVFFSYSS